MSDGPACSHGAILLGCEIDDCPEQSAYVNRMNDTWDAYVTRQVVEACKAVYGALKESPDG